MLGVEPEPRVDGGAAGMLGEVATDEIKVETHAAQNFHLTSESCSKWDQGKRMTRERNPLTLLSWQTHNLKTHSLSGKKSIAIHHKYEFEMGNIPTPGWLQSSPWLGQCRFVTNTDCPALFPHQPSARPTLNATITSLCPLSPLLDCC